MVSTFIGLVVIWLAWCLWITTNQRMKLISCALRYDAHELNENCDNLNSIQTVSFLDHIMFNIAWIYNPADLYEKKYKHLI